MDVIHLAYDESTELDRVQSFNSSSNDGQKLSNIPDRYWRLLCSMSTVASLVSSSPHSVHSNLYLLLATGVTTSKVYTAFGLSRNDSFEIANCGRCRCNGGAPSPPGCIYRIPPGFTSVTLLHCTAGSTAQLAPRHSSRHAGHRYNTSMLPNTPYKNPSTGFVQVWHRKLVEPFSSFYIVVLGP